jgi:hypothetical protein
VLCTLALPDLTAPRRAVPSPATPCRAGPSHALRLFLHHPRLSPVLQPLLVPSPLVVRDDATAVGAGEATAAVQLKLVSATGLESLSIRLVLADKLPCIFVRDVFRHRSISVALCLVPRTNHRPIVTAADLRRIVSQSNVRQPQPNRTNQYSGFFAESSPKQPLCPCL